MAEKMTKITNKQALAEAIELAKQQGAAELVEKLTLMLEVENRKKRSDKLTAEQELNIKLRTQICEYLQNVEKATPAELRAIDPVDIRTSQKVASLIKEPLKDGIILRVQVSRNVYYTVHKDVEEALLNEAIERKNKREEAAKKRAEQKAAKQKAQEQE